MSLKKETLHVAESPSGWMVHHPDGREQSGPHLDRENAIASALMMAKESRARHVKVLNSVGRWMIECTYGEPPAAV